MHRLLSSTALAAVLAASPIAAHAQQPAPVAAPAPAAQAPPAATDPSVAPLHPVVDEYFGVRVEDPYRWMEDLKSPEMRAWMRAQADKAGAALSRIAGRKQILARMVELDAKIPARVAMGVQTPSPRRLPGDVWFYLKRGADEDVEKLFVRRGLAGRERLLADPETFRAKTGKPHAINYFEPSPDGKLVAYGVSEAGSEAASIHVVDVATGKVVDTPIDRAEFGAIAWIPETRSFFYNRLQALTQGMPPIEKYFDSKAYLHVVGRPAEKDPVVFARGTAGVEMSRTDIPYIAVLPGSRWALGVVAHGVQREATVYVAPLEAAKDGTGWTKVVDVPDAVTDLSLHGDDLYVLTHADAPRFRVDRIRLGASSSKPAPVVAQGRLVLLGVHAAKDALYVRARDGATMKLLRVPYGSETKPADVRLQGEGILGLPTTDPRLDGIVATVSSWISMPVVASYDPTTRRLRDTKLQPPGPFTKSSGLTVTHEWATSQDGVRVPLTIVHRADAPRDGSRRAILFGYGAYGFSQDPRADPLRLSWVERGNVWAYCHTRGGGEYGEEWYRAGYKKTKPNTWRDAIACGQRLVEAGWTASPRLALMGGSAGGILVGRAITERPELFGVAIPIVGLADALRFETEPNGPPNVPEFGTVKDEEGFRALFEMSAYHHVKDGVAYPAVLVIHGANDPRVAPWQSAKMAARLQRASTSGKAVLFRIDFDAGHGIGDARSQERAEMADILTFVLWQTGDPGFQP